MLSSGVTGSNNLDGNPQFNNAVGDDYTLNVCTPALDTGDNTSGSSINTQSTDLAGNPRFYNSTTIDIGAYEFQNTRRVYVNHTASGNNDGTSWTDAYTDLQLALDNQCEGLEIWVATGTHIPTAEFETGDAPLETRDRTFYIHTDNVKIYGGFAGTETLLSERNYATNPTIIDGNGYYHAFYIGGMISSNCVLDGLTIKGGNADGTNGASVGGGIYINGFASFSHPTIDNCIFENNAAVTGGAVQIVGSFGSALPTFTNCLFFNNTATQHGGAIFSQGISGNTNSQFINCTFSNNTATISGDVFYGQNQAGITNPLFTNCILWSNGSTPIGSFNASNGAINYCIYDDGTADGSVTLPSNFTGSNNLDGNPNFADAANDDYTLTGFSPAIDNGDATSGSSANTQTKNLAYTDRFYNNSTIDIGAYEYEGVFGSNQIYVNHAATGGNNGTSWASAYTNLQDAIDEAKTSKKPIWVATGTYYPTKDANGNPNGRNNLFHINSDSIKIYGGFTGSETQLAERNPAINVTTLSGDIGTQGVATDNNFRIIYFNANGAENITEETIIDGFTITGGYGSNGGGAIYNFVTGAGNSSKPLISNCKITNNFGTSWGGAVHNQGDAGGESGPTFMNCLFTGNTVSNFGSGSAIYNEAYIGGIISTRIINCTFDNNTGGSSGEAMYNLGYVGSTFSTEITNSIFWTNLPIRADLLGFTTLNNSIYYDGSINNAAPALPALVSGSNNLDSDPMFINAANGDYSLQDMSPAVNIGNAPTYNAINNANTKDLANNQRIYGTTIDAGAYENQAMINLPVELLDFTATLAEENTVQLDWQTATEINNDYFDVEWSTDGIEFQKIGEVQGAGTTNEVQFYEFTDNLNRVVHEYSGRHGLHYYRLKQVDFDGKFEYSEVVNINIQIFEQLNTQTIKIYPNPTTDYIIIEINEPTQVQLINTNGQVLINQFLQQTEQLSIGHLPNGMYWLKVNGSTYSVIKH